MKVNKRKVITKILSYMLVMAMIIGLMPGIGVKAANTTYSLVDLADGVVMESGEFTINGENNVIFTYSDNGTMHSETLVVGQTYQMKSEVDGNDRIYKIEGAFSNTQASLKVCSTNKNSSAGKIVVVSGEGTSQSPFVFGDANQKPATITSLRDVYDHSWKLVEGDRIKPSSVNKYHNYKNDTVKTLEANKKYSVVSKKEGEFFYFFFKEVGSEVQLPTDDAFCKSKNENAEMYTCSNNYPSYIYDFRVSGEMPETGNEAAFEAEKENQKKTADALLKSDDSDACKKLVADAKDAIDKTEYDSNKTLDENKAALKAIVDKLKTDLEAQREGSTTDKKEEFKPADNVPSSEVEGLDDALLDGVLTDAEKASVAEGKKATLTLEMTNIDGSVNAEDKALTEKAAQSVNKNAQIGTYFDLSLLLTVGNSIRKVNNTGSKDLKFKLKVPEKYHAPKGVIRTFFIIRIHASKSDILAKTTSTTIPFSSSDFSTYALAYVDEPIKGFYPGLKISQKDGKIKVSWEKVEGATKYAVYVTYCGKDMPKKANTKVKTNKATIKKIGGKKIDFSKNMKMYVVAYDSSGNAIGKSVSAHFAGKDSKKYKNPKDIKLSTKNISISTGGTANIKASVKMESGKKKAISTNHAAKLRYASSDISVATVDKSGKVTGVGVGTCTVYVYAQNGLAKKVTVTVN